MTIRLSTLTQLLLASFVFCCCADGQNANQLYGQWKVTEVVDASPVVAMSGAAAARLVGHFLVLEPHRARFANEVCQPTYEVSTQTATEFIQDNKVDPRKLNLPEPIVQFDIGCTFVYPSRSGEIIVAWNGFFLAAKKLPEKR